MPWAGMAVAQTTKTDDPEVLIGYGVALRKHGEDAKAHGYFERAYRIAPMPRTAAQLGLCDLAVGRWLDAEDHLSEALVESDPWIAKQRPTLEASREKARTKLGRVQINGAPSRAKVIVNARPPIALRDDHAIWVVPGAVHLKVEGGGAVVERDVVVNEGSSADVDVAPTGTSSREAVAAVMSGSSPAAEDAAATARRASAGRAAEPADGAGSAEGAAAQDTTARWRTPAVWTATGLAIAALGLGLLETMQYNARTDAFNDPKRNPLCHDGGSVILGGPECERLASEGNRARTFAIVGYVTGGALALTAVILQFATRSQGAAAAPQAALGCAPQLGPGAGGVACALRF